MPPPPTTPPPPPPLPPPLSSLFDDPAIGASNKSSSFQVEGDVERATTEGSAAATLQVRGVKVQWKVHGILLILNTGYGFFHVLAHIVLETMHPVTFAMIRPCLATFPILILARCERKSWQDAISPSPRALLLWTPPLGLLIISLVGWMLFVGNHLAGAGITAAVQPTLPVMTAGLGLLIGTESISWKLGIGLFITSSGAMVLTAVWDESIRSISSLIGTLLLVGEVFVLAIYLLLFESKLKREESKGGPHMSPMKTYFFLNVFGALINIVVGIPFTIMHPVAWSALGWKGWFGVFYGGIAVSGFGHATFSWCATKVSSTTTAVYVGWQAIVGEILADIALAEGLQWYKIVGSGLIISGVLLVVSRKRKIMVESDSNEEKEILLTAEPPHSSPPEFYEAE